MLLPPLGEGPEHSMGTEGWLSQEEASDQLWGPPVAARDTAGRETEGSQKAEAKERDKGRPDGARQRWRLASGRKK